jgi:hypothetical protein
MRYINAGLKKLKNNTIGSNLAECTAMNPSLRIVVVAPDLDIADPDDDHAIAQAERSRSLRIGLLESGFNLIDLPPPTLSKQHLRFSESAPLNGTHHACV